MSGREVDAEPVADEPAVDSVAVAACELVSVLVAES